eukprot:Amastigsp_a485_50.p3 type:complete len:158 gc:universal Amastigsp_a485_50:134-607(+)
MPRVSASAAAQRPRTPSRFWRTRTLCTQRRCAVRLSTACHSLTSRRFCLLRKRCARTRKRSSSALPHAAPPLRRLCAALPSSCRLCARAPSCVALSRVLRPARVPRSRAATLTSCRPPTTCPGPTSRRSSWLWVTTRLRLRRAPPTASATRSTSCGG